jgi:hypothetical protein
VEANDEDRVVGAPSIVSFASEPALVAHHDDENAPVNVPNSRPNRARIATRQKCRSREALWLNNLAEAGSAYGI